MNTIINLDSNQQEKLSRILGRHLSKSPQGKEIIAQFENNRERGVEALLTYLDTILSEDRKLTNEIADVLGERYGEQFTTIVTSGGSVGEIINIRQLDKLEIRYYVFSDVQQVITLLLGVVIIGGAIAFGIWWSGQPARMTGDFNIAVAEFVQTGETDPIAPIVSQRIFSFLEGQYSLSSFEDVQVTHDKIGVITNAEEARALAQRINAHLIIYGDVTVVGEQVLFTPRFYVEESHQTDVKEASDVGEINGEHKLSTQINFMKENLVNPSDKDLEMMQRSTSILTNFTKALVYLAAGEPEDLILARESIEQAILESNQYGEFDGKEVLYLFGSDIARRQHNLNDAQEYINNALDLNENYARGLVAQANIYYDQGDLFRAKATYELAKNTKDPPFGAYIPEKASLGIGNVCTNQLQFAVQQRGIEQPGLTEYANCALENFQYVIDTLTQQENPEVRLQELAALAFLNAGIVYQTLEQCPAARQVFSQSIELSNDVGLSQEAEARKKDCEK